MIGDPLTNHAPSGRRALALTCLAAACVAATSACGTPAGVGDAAEGRTTAAAIDAVTGPVQHPGTMGADLGGSVHPVTTVVITDDPAVAAAGVTAEGTWPALLAQSLDLAGSPLELTPAAVEGAGLASDGSSGGGSFTELVVERVVHDTQLVVFFDTDLGSSGAAAVAEGALEAFDAVEEAAPDARVVVVAPYRYSPRAAQPSEAVRQAVRDAISGAEVAVEYIDPVGEGWPTGATSPQVAALVLPHVADLVAALARSGAWD